MTIGTRIIEAALQEEGTSELRNPILKLLLIVLPLCLVFNEAATRHGGGVPARPEQILILQYGMLVATVVCLGEVCVRRFARVSTAYGILLLGLAGLLAGRDNIFREAVTLLARVYNEVPLLSALSMRTWITILGLGIAVRAAHNVHSRDALWYGRTFLSGWAFRAYIVFIVTHAVVHSVLFSKLAEAWGVARARFYLGANPGSARRKRGQRLLDGFAHFLSVLGRAIEYVGDLIFSLVHERGFFTDDYRDAHPLRGGRGDILACIVLAMMAVAAIVLAILDPSRISTVTHQ